MTLTRLARTDVTTAAPDTPVADIAAAMAERDEDVVAVLDEGRPRGLLTAADLGRAYAAGEPLADRTAADLVGDDPVTVEAVADREALLAVFEASDTRRAVVVDEAGDFVGVVAVEDLLVAFGRELERVLDRFDRER